jgi:hypothetical protein
MIIKSKCFNGVCGAGVQCDEREGRDGEVRVSLFRSQVGEHVYGTVPVLRIRI